MSFSLVKSGYKKTLVSIYIYIYKILRVVGSNE